ncbi:MAG: murein biosynthesis integral membrane protein MurJ [Proteobacteria bacterium]|nr:murein biosynthesis integral membrane protein MurJ [Pseudomonadota bacterium]
MTRTAGVVGALTFVSRVLGFARDACIAWFFGAGVSSDAFFVAFRIPNLLRRLFAEGSLSMAFVAVFTETLVKNGKEDAYGFAGSALKWLSLVLTGVTLGGILLAPWIIGILAPGFTQDPTKFALTVLMTRIMFPYVFFIGLVAVCMGILNVLGHFAAPALAPVLLNLAMIGSMLWVSPRMDEPVLGLCFGVVFGGALQLALQVPFLVKKGLRVFRKVSLYHPGIKKAAFLLIPTIFGAAAYHVNMLTGTFLASFLDEGSISYLYYAEKLIEFPLGIFAATATATILPVMSRQAASGDLSAIKDTFCASLQLLLYVTIPAMVGLLVLREPIVSILLERGEFNQAAVKFTADALKYYGIGIWAFASERILVSTFYALQDARTPVRVALISVVVNIGAACLLMIPMGFCGIALAASLASTLNFILLFNRLNIKLGGIELKGMVTSAGKTILGSLVMGLTVHGFFRFLVSSGEESNLSKTMDLAAGIFTGVISYGLFSLFVRQPEFMAVCASIRKRISR